jgi:AraC-like DNA-binding protein
MLKFSCNIKLQYCELTTNYLYFATEFRNETSPPLQMDAASTGTIRAAGLQGFRRLVADLGGDADDFLITAGINPEDLSSPDNLISYAGMIHLLEDCARELGCPDFGLRLSGYQTIDILGPAAMIAHYSDTVGDSLRAVATYLFVHTSGAAVQLIHLDDRRAALTFEVLIPGLHAHRQINELSVGIGQSLLEMLIAPGFRCEQLRFTHRRPRDLKPLNRHFGSQLSFGHSVNSLIFGSTNLSKPVQTANTEFRSIAVDYVRDRLGNEKDNQVRRAVLLVHQLLPTGRCSLKSVSDILGMHPRTLQRELRKSGADFRGIIDRTRRELVADYLVNTDASLTQVAAMLGYGDQAAFNNAFRRWYGMPPGRWRGESG